MSGAPYVYTDLTTGKDHIGTAVVQGGTPNKVMSTNPAGYADRTLHAPLSLMGASQSPGTHLLSIPNGAFEDGLLGWTLTDTGTGSVQIDATASLVGANAALLTVAAQGDVAGLQSGAIPCGEGIPLYLGFRAMVKSGAASLALYAVCLGRDRSTVVKAVTVPLPAQPTASGFAEIGAIVTPPAGTRYVVAQPEAYGQPGAIWIDEVRSAAMPLADHIVMPARGVGGRNLGVRAWLDGQPRNTAHFGAIEDGTVHYVSELYTPNAANYAGFANLAAVQAAYGLPQAAATDTIDWIAYQAAIDWAQSAYTGSEISQGKIFSTAGKKAVLSQGLNIVVPIAADFAADMDYMPATGSCIVVNGGKPTNGAYGFDLSFGTGRHLSGNGAIPTRIGAAGTGGAQYAESGANFLDIRCMFGSKVVVRGNIVGFTNNGLYLNCQGLYPGNHVQGNRFEVIGDIAYCGRGVFLDSFDPASGAAQANDLYFKDIYSNYENLRIDRDTVTQPQSNNNRIFAAMDKAACLPNGSGKHVILNGGWNYIRLSFMECTDQNTGYSCQSFNMNSVACFNRVHVHTSFTDFQRFYDANSATSSQSNVLTTDQPQYVADGSQSLNRSEQTGTGASGTGPFPIRRNLSGRSIVVSFTTHVSGGQTTGIYVGRRQGTLQLIESVTPPSGEGQWSITLSAVVQPGDFYQVASTATANDTSLVRAA